MANIKDRIGSELKSLLEEGSTLLDAFEKRLAAVRSGYQTWYTRAILVVRQLIPERLEEFLDLYEEKSSPYAIAKYLRRTSTTADQHRTACMRFYQQYSILESAQTRLDNILTNIHGIVQAEILDNELDAAAELWRAGHIRATGTIAGVVLERHLAKACSARNLTSRKKNPTISDWNDVLKDDNVYDIPNWRGIQRLADIRNFCTHPKDRDPTKDEVDELIRGVERITKTIF